MVDSKTISKGIVRAVLILVAIYLGAMLILQISSLFIYTALAFVLALIGKPLVEFFKKKLRIKRTLAVVITIVIYIAFFIGFIFMFIPLFTTQAQNLSVLNTSHLQEDFNGLIHKLDLYLSTKGFSLDTLLESANFKSQLKLDFVPNLFNTLLGFLSEFGMGVFAILFITFFFLKDQVILEYQFKKIFPSKHENKVLTSLDKINNLLSRYFLGLVAQITVIFILSFILLAIVGVNGALMIAFLCAILNIIPYIGPLIGNVLAVLFTMLSFLGDNITEVTLPKALTVMFGFLFIQLIDNVVNQPLIFSNSVKSHPLEIFIVILASGMFSGIFGMIAAVPIYTCIKVIAKEFLPNVRFIQILTKKL
ncbi:MULTISPECIES: AI-2E family transporter [Myroides]|uniref:AI-2E family transporter n=1 Tax=Myroides albus TaxID=2562892 RepID=A0A6I3LIH8_9FLAO|nr:MULTISPECIES: AI-2E family transporter [Myroides]MTG97614.1 AI-2E family transporter [Myroides albus]MVX36766.1 AI-2E family transporter [Myroides sp. LoEW2-1]UVD79238.1 AI-2E family transporter [Myroides albus]